jgi:hypothetical protein
MTSTRCPALRSILILSLFTPAWLPGRLSAAADVPPEAAAAPDGPPARRELVCPTPEQMRERWFKPLDRIPARIPADQGKMPMNCAAQLFTDSAAEAAGFHQWTCTQFQWVAPEVDFQPTYFDEVPLERYGQSAFPALQPAISAAHFFAAFPVMPYKMGLDSPYERVYSLGYYRPGSPAPGVSETLPWDFHAFFVEGGAWTAAVLLLP